jgi:hypothetical protein
VNRARVVEALKQLLAHEPAPDEVYVERSAPGSVAWPWPARLELLVDAGQRPRLLMHGPIGVGKSTELLRWERRLREAGRPVVRLAVRSADIEDRFLVNKILGQAFQLVHSEAENSGDLWAWARKWHGILLVDGLDLAPPPVVSSLFGPSTHLVQPDCPAVVYVAPNSLLTVNPATDRDPRFDEVAYVAPFPVLDESHRANREVVDWLAAGLRRRLKAVDLPVEDAVFAIAAFASGGIPRDAIRILRNAIILSADATVVSAGAALAGRREVRQDLEQSLTVEEHDAVKRGDWANHRNSLIQRNAVLVYEGAERRYEVLHPLLADARAGMGALA